MIRICVASCLLAVIAAAPAETKKEFPAWPTQYSFTIQVTYPHNTPEGAKGEQEGKIYYDSETGNAKKEFQGKAMYGLSNFNGRGAAILKDGDECTIIYDPVAVQEATKSPLQHMDNTEYLSNVNLEGVEVEQWKWEHGKDPNKKHVLMMFLTREGAYGKLLQAELYKPEPPAGSDMILPIVIKTKNFSATKPDPSVFNIDANKCKEASKLPDGFAKVI